METAMTKLTLAEIAELKEAVETQQLVLRNARQNERNTVYHEQLVQRSKTLDSALAKAIGDVK
jgi:hypothetical protein